MARTREARKKARGTSLGGRLRSLRPRDAALLVVKAGAFSVLVLTLVFFCLVLLLPLPESPVPQATQVFDANGRSVSSLFVQNRTVVPSGDIPNALKQGTVAVEDKRFYEHPGIDLESLARALVRDLKARAYVEGGSTVTMQLAKNLFLTEEKTLHRKFIESVYTLKLEMRYTKDEILTMYLNQIYFGHGTWGCEVASETYFGKHVKDLTLAECAMVAGIIRSPENYSPYNDPALAVSRRSLVLGLMADQGYISPEERDAAEKAPVLLAGLPKNAAPYFVAYVISQLESRHPEIGDQIYRGGYRIYTTLDLDMQKAAEEAFARHMPEGAKDAQGVAQPQGALVALEPSTGYVKAMIGGRDWDETQLNRACQVKRQPGSAFKIFLYAAVLDRRHAVTETKVCEPVTYPGAATGERYRPVDFGRQPYHYAPLDIRQAVAVSDNVVATKWAQEIGPETIIDYARRLGVKSPLEASIPLALGASEVVPLDMAVAAATLAAGGIRPEPVSILKVVDAMGQVIEENRVKRTPALDAGTAYVLTSVLRSVLGPYGTGSGLGAWLGSRPAAGKTGTTDGQLEAWFVGYTRELACTVYVGWDHREKSLPGTGGAVAGPIWADFVGTALRDVPVKDWAAPPNVTWTEVCDDTNLLAGPRCPSRHYEVFLKDALPPVDTAPAERHPRKQTADFLKDLVLPETEGTAESGTLSGVPPVRPMETFPLPPGGPPQIPR